LIGENLMKEPDPAVPLRALIGAGPVAGA